MDGVGEKEVSKNKGVSNIKSILKTTRERRTENEGSREPTKNLDCLDHRSAEIGRNTSRSSAELRRLVITRSSSENQELLLVLKKLNNNNNIIFTILVVLC